MSEEIKIKTYDEWLKYYENATKEDIIYDLTKDVEYFADAVKDIKELQQELTKYKERNEKAVIREPFHHVMLNHKDYKLPAIASIMRARRKVYERYPYLNPKNIKKLRKDKEEEYKEYSRS